MTFNAAVNAATKHLIRSKAARTVGGYTLEMEKTEYGIACTTWGFDYQTIAVPSERIGVIRRKMRLQMLETRDTLDNVELRYLLDILKRETNN